MNPVEEILQLQTKTKRERGSRFVEAFRALSTADGRELAYHAIGFIDDTYNKRGGSSKASEQAEELLLHLACLVPGALDGLHGELLDREVICPAELFLNADATARDRMLVLLEEVTVWWEREGRPPIVMFSWLLSALAWVGDEIVQSIFLGWRANPPIWRIRLCIPPEDYGQQAGWHLAGDGQYRRLFHETCWELIGRGKAETSRAEIGEFSTPVRAILPCEEACRWCGRPLETLFAFDLRDPRLAFLNLSGQTLRLARCPRCSNFGTLYTEVDTQGGVRWSQHNVRPDYIGDDDEDWHLPQDTLTLGRLRLSPYEAHEFILYFKTGASQVGGHPMWIQDAEYPLCPGCGEPMPFVAQLQTEDVAEHHEGVTYGFLCSNCMMAATTYQQT